MSNVPISAVIVGTHGVRFVASLQPDMSNPIFTAWVDVGQYGVAKSTFTGLAPDTRYHVGYQPAGGEVAPLEATFKTPASGAHSFSFCAASCSNTASNAYTFQRIKDRADADEIAFFVHLGDVHYDGIAVNDEGLFHQSINNALFQPRQNAMWRSLPVLYMWDDWDYGPNDSDRDSTSRQAAIAAFRRRVPTPPLARFGPEDAPYYSLIRGRVRFIFSDVRSERARKGQFASTDPQQVVFASAQRDWFFGELQAAAAASQAVIWINTKPWVAAVANGADHWGGYGAARQEIAGFITSNGLASRIAILAGDMHALAYDDGSSSNNAAGLKVMQAAALDRTGSNKGGPYTTGPIRVPASGVVRQYGLIDVTDTGTGDIGIRFRGYSIDTSDVETLVLDESFTLTA